MQFDTLIIGGGPAGLSAALVLGRCVRRVLVLDSGRYRNARSTALHCYLGHDGILPLALRDQSRDQLKRYDTIKLFDATVVKVSRCTAGFTAVFDDGQEVVARTVLFTTGVVDELPHIPGLHELFGRSVHVCPYCDGWEHRDAPIAVFGRGSKGAGLALLLRQWTQDLVLCSHGPAGLAADEQQLLDRRGINVRETAIAELHSDDGRLRAIRFEDGEVLSRQALFFTTGQHPRSTFLEHLGCTYDEKGVTCDEDGATSVPGVYVAGDVSRDVQLAIIAAAEGARAALAINKALLRADGHL
jgi:thioredoxin reductase